MSETWTQGMVAPRPPGVHRVTVMAMVLRASTVSPSSLRAGSSQTTQTTTRADLVSRISRVALRAATALTTDAVRKRRSLPKAS